MANGLSGGHSGMAIVVIRLAIPLADIGVGIRRDRWAARTLHQVSATGGGIVSLRQSGHGQRDDNSGGDRDVSQHMALLGWL